MVKRVEKNPAGGLSVAGFVMGILALVFVMIPFLNFIFAILGLIFSGVGVKRKEKKATAGLVMSIIAMVFVILGVIFAFASIGMARDRYEKYEQNYQTELDAAIEELNAYNQ